MAKNKLKRSWTFVLGVLLTYIGYKWIGFSMPSAAEGIPWLRPLIGILVTIFGLLILGRSFFNE